MGKEKVAKNDPLFLALGGLDELNSWIGFCRAGSVGNSKLKEVAQSLKNTQESLFIVQAEIAAIGSKMKPKVRVSVEKTEDTEREIACIDAKIPKITRFIIPGESEVSARLDVARTMARRVERAVKEYSTKKLLRPELLQYLNRLSSLLFALARLVNHQLKIKEEHPSYK